MQKGTRLFSIVAKHYAFRAGLSSLFAAFLCGCHTPAAQYKLIETDRWTGPKIDKVLLVRKIEEPPSDRVLSPGLQGGAEWRTNYRGRYKDADVANDVSAMIAKHLAFSGLFKEVRYEPEGSTGDWELVGLLGAYRAYAKVNTTAERVEEASSTAGVMFGAIGAATFALTGELLNSKQKTEIASQVSLENLRLRDLVVNRVIWNGSVTVSTNFTAHWRAAKEEKVFRHADQSLKAAVNELIRQLGSSNP